MNKLKILHVGDKAGVAGCLAKFQRRIGQSSNVVVTEVEYDTNGLGHHQYYKPVVVGPVHRRFAGFGKLTKPLRFLQRKVALLVFYVVVGFYSRRFDVVHIHSDWKVGFFIRKPKVFEFHGSDVRGFPLKKGNREKKLTALFLKVFGGKYYFLVSTKDLLKCLPCAEWLANPVDRDIFKKNPERLGCYALYIKNYYESDQRAVVLCDVKQWGYAILDRGSGEIVSYRAMPTFLGNFDYFIDRHSIHSLSKTALEALAVGCKVVDWKGEIVRGLPVEHEPFTVARKSLVHYDLVIGGYF